jgi:hypothetical protein
MEHGRIGSFGRAEIKRRYAGAFANECPRNGRSDSPRSAGNNGCLARKSHDSGSHNCRPFL